MLEELEKKRGPITGLYFHMQEHPELLRKFSDLGGYLRFQGILPKEVKNWITLVVAKKLSCKRVWETHLKETPLSQELLSSLQEEKKPKAPYGLLRDFVWALLERKTVDFSLKNALRKIYTEPGFLEIIFLSLFYESFIQASKVLQIE